MDIRRAVIIVMDSCGVGEAPDAADYGDVGADTIGHVSEAVGGLSLPNFQQAGLGNLHPAILGVPPAENPTMAFGRMREASGGKDSTTGHWEIAGLVTEHPHATFTDTGFPPELVERLTAETGYQYIGNYAASGTVIIDDLGPEHLESGALILYTSADSVLQIAAHDSVADVPELHRVCGIARTICDDYRIGRVIARPFIGEIGSFHRTYDRKDFAMPPHGPTIIDKVKDAGLRTYGVGKIEDLFVGRGLTDAVHTEGDRDGLERTVAAINEVEQGLIFANLVDLDMRYGHRENPEGYAAGLAVIDEFVPHLLDALTPLDLLIFTADHGNDPTDGDTDHTREYVPLLVWSGGAAGVNLGARDQYTDVAATVAEGFDLEPFPIGASFLHNITAHHA
jgi:phosphopentomutase